MIQLLFKLIQLPPFIEPADVSLLTPPHHSLPYLAIGGGSGDLIVWDINKASPRFSLSNCHQGNVIKVIWHPKIQHVLFSSSVDGSVMGWDVRNGQRLGSFVGHRSAILGTSITP